MEQFDLVVIGGGPAGYTGAIRASQLGMKVVCIDSRPTLGGTCLNVGCIPSKALLNYSEKYEEANKHFADIGIKFSKLELDLAQMLGKKNKIVGDLCKGIEGLFVKNKVKRITGYAKIVSSNIVEVSDGTKLEAKNILIATGSNVSTLPNVDIDEKSILSSAGALDVTEVPKTLIVIGGGIIGLELGSVWRRLGAEVMVVEYLDRITPSLDNEVSNQLMKILDKQGMKFKLGTKVTKAELASGGVTLALQPANGGVEEKITVDKVLVAVGRKPNIDGLGLNALSIPCDKRGYIEVNEKYQTAMPNIYAVGDVITGPMLAHKAEEEAVAAVEIMAGQMPHVNYNTIPSVIYTWPEVASVGATEEELKAQGKNYKVGKFPFSANSRARAGGNIEGFVKLLACSKTDEILGGHIIGPDAGTMIAEIVLGMEFKAAAEDIARTCHAHPTLNEAIKEAALAVDKRTINF